MELREKDTQKVVAGLKCCIPYIQQCSDCYLKERKDNCYGTLLMDAVQHIEELKNKNERLGELLVRTTALDGGRAQRPSPTMEWISVEDEPLPKLSCEINRMWYRRPDDLPAYIAFYGNGASNDVTHWMQLDPPKPKEPTFKDVFLKAFPKTSLGYNGALKLCARNVFPQINCSLSSGCAECWKQTYFEGEGREE